MAQQSAPSSSNDSDVAARLAADLDVLNARQVALREELARRQSFDAEASETVAATFGQLPEYVDKLRRVQTAMDELAGRTSQMRERCSALLQDPR